MKHKLLPLLLGLLFLVSCTQTIIKEVPVPVTTPTTTPITNGTKTLKFYALVQSSDNKCRVTITVGGTAFSKSTACNGKTPVHTTTAFNGTRFSITVKSLSITSTSPYVAASVTGAGSTVRSDGRKEVTASGVVNTSASTTTTTTPTTTTVSLTVNASGNGEVNGCSDTCTKSYDKGTTVRLTATPNTGSEFLGWAGRCSGTSTQCETRLNADTTITASFSN